MNINSLIGKHSISIIIINNNEIKENNLLIIITIRIWIIIDII